MFDKDAVGLARDKGRLNRSDRLGESWDPCVLDSDRFEHDGTGRTHMSSASAARSDLATRT